MSKERGMTVTPEPRWEWIDMIVGLVMGAISGLLGVLGWTNRQHNILHERINETNKAAGLQASQIATLKAHHEANANFQERVDESLKELNRKNEDQLKILLRLDGRMFGTNSHGEGRGQ